jgi:hypothetical protein
MHKAHTYREINFATNARDQVKIKMNIVKKDLGIPFLVTGEIIVDAIFRLNIWGDDMCCAREMSMVSEDTIRLSNIQLMGVSGGRVCYLGNICAHCA